MLDDEIRKVSHAHTRKYQRMGIVLLVILAVLAIILGGIHWTTQTPETDIQQLPEISYEIPATPEVNNEDRDNFKRQLVAFELQLAAIESAAGITHWRPQRFKQLLDEKQLALNNFSNQQYAEALQRLDSGTQLATQLKADWEQAYSSSLLAAQNYFNQDDAARAQLNLQQGLAIKPGDPELLALGKRIQVLPKIKQLLADIDIAKVENNQQRQADLLRKIVALDPDRSELVNNLKRLDETLEDMQFTDVIKKGLAHIEQSDVAAAVKSLNKAITIDPARNEISLLKTKIARTKAELSLEHFLSRMKRLIAEDNWQQLQKTILLSGARFDSNPKTLHNLKLSRQMLMLEAKLESYLTRPDRLSDTKINRQALIVVDNSQLLAQNSPRITRKLSKLKKQLKLYSVAVMVTIYSDGKTNINIVGRGHIGKTKLHQMRLKPGKYVFQGERKGYRSKHINLSITPTSITPEITIICNERI